MQLIAETYDFLKRGKGKDNAEIAGIFGGWNQGTLQGFLVEITQTVLLYKDPKTGESLVDKISDKAKSKGTGKWTSQDAMDLGLPIPTIDAAVNAREISGYKPEREQAEKIYAAPGVEPNLTTKELESALYAAVLLAYAQGLALITSASDEYGYKTDLREVAKVWRAGCIIRSASLEPIREAFERKPDLANLLLDAKYSAMLTPHIAGLRTAVIESAKSGIPAPAFGASLAYFDSYRTGRLPANLIQAQRDLFGAHTYERLDESGTFHTQWQPA
jgi:6-phosphogluconate dehydrogenase